jgi:hypothetical protein
MSAGFGGLKKVGQAYSLASESNMQRNFRNAAIATLIASIAGVIAWSGYLAFVWYRGYSVGKLIAVDVVRDEHPFERHPDFIESMKTFHSRKQEIERRLAVLGPWQRDVAY